MTTTSEANRTQNSEGAARPSPNRAWVLMVAAVVLVALGLARFNFNQPEVDPLPATVLTTREKVASLEAEVVSAPNVLFSWQELASAHIQAATETGDPSHYSRAEAALDEATALDPGNQNTAVGIALLALTRHDFEQAREIALGLVQQDPFTSQGLLVLVDAEIELGLYEESAAHLQQLLDLKPALPALTRTSYLRELHGDLPGAEQAMVQALTAGSRSTFDQAVTATLLGDLYLKQGDLERADERYLVAQGLAPDLFTAGIGRARVAVANGQLDQAATWLGEVVDRFPEPGALALLGEVLTVLGRTEEAEQAFATVEVIADLQRVAGATIDLELARFAADHGSIDEALELARAAYAARPTISAAQVLGWSLYRSGDPIAALPYSTESLRLGTRDASLLLEAAAIAAANGDVARAEELREAASGIDPWFHVLRPDLGGPGA